MSSPLWWEVWPSLLPSRPSDTPKEHGSTRPCRCPEGLLLERTAHSWAWTWMPVSCSATPIPFPAGCSCGNWPHLSQCFYAMEILLFCYWDNDLEAWTGPPEVLWRNKEEMESGREGWFGLEKLWQKNIAHTQMCFVWLTVWWHRSRM